MNTINNFVPGSFFEQDHLLNLIILRLYVKEWPKCARISKQTDVAQNLIDDFFSNFVRRPFHRKDFNWKRNMGVRVYFPRESKLCIRT